MVIRQVGVGSAAKIFGVLYAVFGLIFGVLVALSLSARGWRGRRRAMPGWFGGLLGVGAVIFLPIFTACSERSAGP